MLSSQDLSLSLNWGEVICYYNANLVLAFQQGRGQYNAERLSRGVTLENKNNLAIKFVR